MTALKDDDIMNKKSEALLSTYLKEKVAVIHSAFEDSPRTVAFVEVDKSLSIADKLEKAFMLTNSIVNHYLSKHNLLKSLQSLANYSKSLRWTFVLIYHLQK